MAQLPDEAGTPRRSDARWINSPTIPPPVQEPGPSSTASDQRIRAGRMGGDSAPLTPALRGEFALLHLRRLRHRPDDRERAAALLDDERRALGYAGALPTAAARARWAASPCGRHRQRERPATTWAFAGRG